MRRSAVLVYGYALVGIEMVLPAALRLGPTSVAPSFVVPMVVFVAMFAPAVQAYWTALLLGLSLDLLVPWGGQVFVPGPRALGMLAAAYLVVTIRTVINRNLLALIVFSILAAGLMQIVVVALLTFRSLYTLPIPWHPREELVQRMLSALYTGGSAALVGLVLFASTRMFRFPDPYTRRGGTARAY